MLYKKIIFLSFMFLLLLIIILQFIIFSKIKLIESFMQVANLPSKDLFVSKLGLPSYSYNDTFSLKNLGIWDDNFTKDIEACLFPLPTVPHKYLVVCFEKSSGKTIFVTFMDM